MNEPGNGEQKAKITTPVFSFDLAGRYTTIILMFALTTSGLGYLTYQGFEKLASRLQGLQDSQTVAFKRIADEQAFTTCMIWVQRERISDVDDKLLRQKCWWIRKDAWPNSYP